MKKVLLALVVLVGTGYAADKVSLSWVPSISPTATNTAIYRATGSCPASGLPSGATKIGQVSAVTAGFDDLTGTPKSVYCYYATALDSVNGVESVGSNSAQATFPVPALAPPTNFTAK